MKISEIIKAMEELKEKFGDIDLLHDTTWNPPHNFIGEEAIEYGCPFDEDIYHNMTHLKIEGLSL